MKKQTKERLKEYLKIGLVLAMLWVMYAVVVELALTAYAQPHLRIDGFYLGQTIQQAEKLCAHRGFQWVEHNEGTHECRIPGNDKDQAHVMNSSKHAGKVLFETNSDSIVNFRAVFVNERPFLKQAAKLDQDSSWRNETLDRNGKYESTLGYGHGKWAAFVRKIRKEDESSDYDEVYIIQMYDYGNL